jgi:hypothetical protein
MKRCFLIGAIGLILTLTYLLQGKYVAMRTTTNTDSLKKRIDKLQSEIREIEAKKQSPNSPKNHKKAVLHGKYAQIKYLQDKIARQTK